MTVPPLPDGYDLRAPVPDDAAGVAEVMNSIDVEIGAPPQTSEDRVSWQWDRPSVNLEGDHRVATSQDGTIVGYVEYEGPEPTQIYVDGYVHPDHRGLGIGTALLSWANERSEAEVARAPADARVVMRQFLDADDAHGRAFLEALGWHIARWFNWMVIDLDAPIAEPGPIAGIEIRPMRPGEEPAVYATDDESFREHWGYFCEPYEDWLHHHLGGKGFVPELVYVAMEDEEMVGCAINVPTRDEDPAKGWIRSLGVRKPWRKRGIGTALLRASFRGMQAHGCTSVGLGVDSENRDGAVTLYLKEGMRVDREAASYEIELRSEAAGSGDALGGGPDGGAHGSS